ncbi:MAG: FMN-binding negative transcriptional regulator [Actinomycetes bacterium]
MWVNPAFRPDSEDIGYDLIRRRPFGTVIVQDPLRVTHLPFVLEQGGEDGRAVLASHVPRVDPISEALLAGTDVLVVFAWPAAYVTPSWYLDVGLPTYNFTAVHVAGATVPMETPAELRRHLLDLVREHEAGFPTPWEPDAAAYRRMADLTPHIGGFRLPVERIEVKVKLGQNRSAAERRRIVENLSRSTDTDKSVLAEYTRLLD